MSVPSNAIDPSCPDPRLVRRTRASSRIGAAGPSVLFGTIDVVPSGLSVADKSVPSERYRHVVPSAQVTMKTDGTDRSRTRCAGAQLVGSFSLSAFTVLPVVDERTT